MWKRITLLQVGEVSISVCVPLALVKLDDKTLSFSEDELLGLSSVEFASDFKLEYFVNSSPLPDHYGSDTPKAAIRSYVNDYLRVEIIEEGLTRNLPVFLDFLLVAALGDTEVLNMSNVARESGVTVSTVRDHYQILEDTLMGALLPAFTLRAKRRITMAPKFYFRELGVVDHLARRSKKAQSFLARRLETGYSTNCLSIPDPPDSITTSLIGDFQVAWRWILFLLAERLL